MDGGSIYVPVRTPMGGLIGSMYGTGTHMGGLAVCTGYPVLMDMGW